MDAMVHACLHLMLGEKRTMRVTDPSEYRLGMDYDLGNLMPRY